MPDTRWLVGCAAAKLNTCCGLRVYISKRQLFACPRLPNQFLTQKRIILMIFVPGRPRPRSGPPRKPKLTHCSMGENASPHLFLSTRVACREHEPMHRMIGKETIPYLFLGNGWGVTVNISQHQSTSQSTSSQHPVNIHHYCIISSCMWAQAP